MVAAVATPDVVTYMPRGGCRDFYTAIDSEVLAVGPAGTGKTLAACWKLHHIAIHAPGARILMVRKVLEDLKAGALATYTNQVKPELDNVRAFGGNRFYPGEFRYDNGSVLQVVGMDKPGKVMSAEYDVIYANEATELTEDDWESLKSRLRNGRYAYQQLLGDCNPTNPRHWLRARCENGLTRYIQTTHQDNPLYWDTNLNAWTTVGYAYVQQTLAGLTGIRRKRLFEGVWAAAEGVVYPEFDFQTNVRTMDCTGWRTILGGDIGARNPTALLTIRRSGDGRTHIERERYQRNMGADDITDAICDEMQQSKAEVGWLDPSAKAYIDACVLRGYNVKGANNDVKHGIGVVTTAFADGLTVDPSCVNTIAEFESYAWQEGATEKDAPIKQNDHAMDGIRYALVGDSVPQPEIRVW
jgi:PBSX family phage terminase large subunit